MHLNFIRKMNLTKTDTKVKVAGCDIDGVSRGKIMSIEKFLKIQESGFGFCNVIFGWDILDKVYSFPTQDSFSDLIAIPDVSTFRRIPWEDNIPFLLVDFYDAKTLEPFQACPRSLLKRILAKTKDLGYDVMCGMEYEFYNFKETPDSLEKGQGTHLNALTPVNFILVQ